jgi:hypothetical protein
VTSPKRRNDVAFAARAAVWLEDEHIDTARFGVVAEDEDARDARDRGVIKSQALVAKAAGSTYGLVVRLSGHLVTCQSVQKSV